MRGLLIKDSHIMTKSGVGATLFEAAFAAFALGALGMNNQMWLPLVLVVYFVNGNLFYDRNSGWEKSAVVMPVSRKNIVQSKYLLFAVTGMIGLVYGVVLTRVICTVFGYPLVRFEMTGYALSSAVLALCIGAVDLPVCLIPIKLVRKKLLFVTLLAAGAAGLILLLMVPGWLHNIHPIVYFAVLSMLAGAVYFCSYVTVCRRYTTMDL